MHVRKIAVAGMVLISVIVGCEGPELACSSVPRPAVIANVHDASGRPQAYRASLILSSDGVYDSVFVDPELSPGIDTAAFDQIRSRVDRGGVFTVRVRKAGFAVWSSTIGVDEDRCGARTRSINAVIAQ